MDVSIESVQSALQPKKGQQLYSLLTFFCVRAEQVDLLIDPLSKTYSLGCTKVISSTK
jgi:hypothetical protein